jgi:hypothetical protein
MIVWEDNVWDEGGDTNAAPVMAATRPGWKKEAFMM